MKLLKTLGTAATLLLFGITFGTAAILAQTTPPADPPKPSLESVTTERDALKAEVATLKGQLEEMKRAIALVQQQRNSALASMSDVQAQLQLTAEALDAAKKAAPAAPVVAEKTEK